MQDNSLQTDYFCLAVKLPEDNEFSIQGAALHKTCSILKVMLQKLENDKHYDSAEKKIFHFKLIGELDNN